MARIVLTNVQKDELGSSSLFTQQVKWAILNQAVYWQGQDGRNMADVTTSTRWRKSRSFAEIIGAGPSIAESSDIVRDFLVRMKDFPVASDSGYSIQDTVDFMLIPSSVSFSALADKWFDLKISQTL